MKEEEMPSHTKKERKKEIAKKIMEAIKKGKKK